jgi:hypothetical protein
MQRARRLDRERRLIERRMKKMRQADGAAGLRVFWL